MNIYRSAPGFVTVSLNGAVLVIPEWIFVAGLKLGKQLRRQEAAAQRTGRIASDGDV